MFRFLVCIPIYFCHLFGTEYNHPEFEWSTIETEHFLIHFHKETELTAREAATVAEKVYKPVTSFYEFEPKNKTHLILIDPDDYSNGAAYYYENKIMIWASPLEFELRGSHRWLQNVITHEFVHIISLQKSMKYGTRVPGFYLQYMSYENEKRPDVLYGFPNRIVSYPIPGTVVPPWLAEGVAQYMYDDADYDHWDTHRDMILRDRVLNDNLLTFNEMNTFGKKGIGNESTYNSGFALSTFIANEYGSDCLRKIMQELSSPLQYSINNAILNILGISGERLYENFKTALELKYKRYQTAISLNERNGIPIITDGTTNIYPKWNPIKNGFAYLSNKRNDFFSQTDLYYFDLEDSSEIKIVNSVFSAPSWHSNGNIIYYSKKSKFPNERGSRFYDIYSYSMDTKKEKRLTYDARAYNPVFVELDSVIFYLSTDDGSQNIHRLDLKDNETQKITNFNNRSIISFLNYSTQKHMLYYDITTHHYRDISSYNIKTGEISSFKNKSTFDERNIAFGENHAFIYSDDKNGIYNLYLDDKNSSKSGYITNVIGGAFMPDFSKEGNLLFSQYINGQYVISLLDNFELVEDDFVGYSPDYHENNSNQNNPIVELIKIPSKVYEDQFPNMFLMPKLMMDYNTIKPGFYFSSNEIINRLSVFGGASVNRLSDLDLYFIMEFKRFYPTLFFETFYLTRNTNDNTMYQDVYPIEDDIKFRLVQFRSGLRIPLYGTNINLSGTRQWYRAFINQVLSTEDINAGIAYDYFKGWSMSADWSLNLVKRTLNRSIHPRSGLKLNLTIDYEKNKFIEGLNLSESGTLTGDYGNNDLGRFNFDGRYYYTPFFLKNFSLVFGSIINFITNDNVDTFFHNYLGGMTGIKGYPFYSIQGTKSLMLDFALRIPLFLEKTYNFKWLTFQNSTIAGIFQIGDAWIGRTNSLKDFKRSVGFQWRLDGFSFFNYPTAIELEYHQPLDKFYREINNETIYYGEEGRTYVKILFDF